MRPFKDDYSPNRPYLIGSQLLNSRASALNAISLSTATDSSAARMAGGKVIRHPQPLLHILTITNDEEQCDTDSLGNVQAPCPSRDLYLVVAKYWDSTTQRWIERDDEYPLDSSATGRKYSAGNVLPGYWDRLRGAYVPIAGGRVPESLASLYHANFNSQTGISVPQAELAYRNSRDSLVELSLRLKLPGENEFTTIGKLGWRVPYIDTQRAWDDTRAGFVTFLAPHGTKAIFQVCGAWEPADGDDYDLFDIGWLDWIGFEIDGEASEYVDSERDFTSTMQPGSYIKPFLRQTEVLVNSDSSPIWSHNDSGAIDISYEDRSSQSIVAIYYEATLRSRRHVNQRHGGTSYPWFSSINCQNGLLIEYCRREFGFPGGIGARIDFSSSGNPEQCVNCFDNICGTCGWVWTDGSTYDPPVSDFWFSGHPCEETGPSDCACSEPPRVGAFYGELYTTICSEPSSSSVTSLSSSESSSMTSDSTRSSISSISASSSTQSLTTSSDSSTSSLGGG